MGQHAVFSLRGSVEVPGTVMQGADWVCLSLFAALSPVAGVWCA